MAGKNHAGGGGKLGVVKKRAQVANDAPRTSVQLTAISVERIETWVTLLHFERCGAVRILDSVIVGCMAHDASAVFCHDCELTVGNYLLLDNVCDRGTVRAKANILLAFEQTLCAVNEATHGS